MAPRYAEFASKLDLDAIYTALGWEPLYQKANKAGEVEDIGFCLDPWNLHKNGDSTGKLAINREKKLYNCWVCGGGSLVSLIMGLRSAEPDEAIDWLHEYATERDLSDDEFRDEVRSLLAQLETKRSEDVLPYYNPRVLEKWDEYGEDLVAWNQGDLDGKPKFITKDILYLARVRYAPTATKFAPRSKRDGKPLDENYVGPALLFPHYWKDRLVGWQHRWLADDRPKWVSKYTNTPDFPKTNTLYRVPMLAAMKRALSRPLVVVESVPTALMVESLGWPCVATFGASVTPEQLKLLRRYQQGVILAPDNDTAGIRMLVAVADYLDGFIPVSYVYPEGGPGDDLADSARRWGTGHVVAQIAAAERIS